MSEQQYRIVSPRLGKPGDLFEPEVWVNLHALLESGLIERADGTPDTKKAKSTKVSKEQE